MGFGELVKSGAQAALGLAPMKPSALHAYLNDKPGLCSANSGTRGTVYRKTIFTGIIPEK